MSLDGTKKMRSRSLPTVISILVFGWLITVGVALGQHDAGPYARARTGSNIKGTVVSASEKEVTVKADDEEGQVVVAKIPTRRLFNGKWVPDKDLSEFVIKLKPGDKVDLDYGHHGEMSVLRFIKKAGETSGVFQREGPLVTGWVISGTEKDITIETAETATVMVLRVPMRRGEDGKPVRNADLSRKAKQLPRGQLVLVKYRLTDERGIFALQGVKRLSFSANENVNQARLTAELESLERRLTEAQKALREVLKGILGRDRPQTTDRPHD